MSKCQQCKRDVDPKQLTKVVWRRKGVSFVLCPICTTEFYRQDIKDVDITKEQMMKAGHWQQGMKPVDIKSSLEKWSKNRQWIKQ